MGQDAFQIGNLALQEANLMLSYINTRPHKRQFAGF